MSKNKPSGNKENEAHTMKFCNDCGNRYGLCTCEECGDCGELATDKCFECESHFCDECLATRPGSSPSNKLCGECLAKLATYAPCANRHPARPCKTLTFAPELLHECAACHQDFCAKCIVATPVPHSIFSAQYHCPRCSAATASKEAA